jgi:hypothetical protein
MEIVSEYSYRKLTKQTDRLIALSGSQTIMNSVQSDTTYLAGIWQNRLPKLLLWKLDNRDKSTCDSQHERPSKYRAPTWSWASIDGPIRYDLHNLFKEETSHINILDYLCVPESSLNPTGTSTVGHITVRGLLMPVELVTRH